MWKDIIKEFLPVWAVKMLIAVRYPTSTLRQYQKDKAIRLMIKDCESQHRRALANVVKVLGKRPLRCVFLGLFDSVWKYDTVYMQMQRDPRFDPMILVCPVVNYGCENMVARMEDCYSFFADKGFKVIRSYNKESGKYVDVRKELNPDIIVYTNPYKGLIDDRYYVTNFPDILTFYVHYGFNSAKAWDMLYKQLLSNVVWRYYVETNTHQKYVRQHSYNKGRNTVVTGYPGIEELISKEYKLRSNPWRSGGKNNVLKKIIWAPHHTIEPVGMIKFSNFLRDADFMIEMADKYKEFVQIAFKPHPLLKNKLYERWGMEKTDNYYCQWQSMNNTFLADGEYIDLFLTSDAMIHDSGSFLIEYLYVDRPVMRVMTDENMSDVLNSFALRCLDHYYKAYNQQDIEQFILNVINDVDPMKEQRTKFVNEVLMPKGSPSQNIINDILDSIDNQILYRN